jgi:hypothetical protein
MKLLRVVLRSDLVTAEDKVRPSSPRLEPSDLFLRLIAATLANDKDLVAVIAHDFTT